MWARAGRRRLPRALRDPRRALQSDTPKARARGFGSYEDTLAFRLHGPKPKAVVIHPVLPGARPPGKPWAQIVWDAEEALGLVRANRWDILPGPHEPVGGWDKAALDEVEELEELQRLEGPDAPLVPEGWHLDRGEDEVDDELDVHEVAWRHDVVRRQWAETCVVKLRKIDPGTFFGKGKVEELAIHVANNPCDYVFVNTTLTPTQSQNLEVVFCNAVAAADARKRREEERHPRGKRQPECQVIDRNRLVLEIFNFRAESSQAKIQAGMARLQYLKTRLTVGTKARLRQVLQVLQEQIGPYHEVTGFKGGVEVQRHYETSPFETERALLAQAERKLKRATETERKHKELQRKGRKGIPMIGIVGYTNVGKTTLMNRITDAGLVERDILFQTLDTTMRRVRLPSGTHAIIADSIGFIQHLPHHIVAAFSSTLDDLVSCDILLHVRDISHPQRKLQKDVVLRTLEQAGMTHQQIEARVVEVWNKIDLLPQMDFVPPEAIPVSAQDGTGVHELLRVVDTVVGVQVELQRRTVTFPRERMSEAMAFLHRNGSVDEGSLAVEEGALAVEGECAGAACVSVDAILPKAAWGAWQATFELRALGRGAPRPAELAA